MDTGWYYCNNGPQRIEGESWQNDGFDRGKLLIET